MTTIINNPGGASEESSGWGIVVGVLIALALIALFFVYGLPSMRNKGANPNGAIDVNVKLPTTPAPAGGSGTAN